jgi:hypothetical protein
MTESYGRGSARGRHKICNVEETHA